MISFYIVRHGNTFAPGEPARRIGPRTDLPLVDSGERQARSLGRHFAAAGVSFRRALSGPLRRARQTAEAVLAESAEPPVLETAWWLNEVDHGPDEDMQETTVIARIGRDAITAWDGHAEPPAGWIVDTPAREAAWRQLFTHAGDGSVLLSTSNGAARFALRSLPPGPDLPTLKLRTGAYGLVTAEPGRAPRVEVWDVRP